MPEMKHFWTGYNPYQKAGTTVEWTWPVGENEHYWGYSVRPFQFNSSVEVLRQWTTSDNGGGFTEHFLVTTTTGGLIRFSALAAVGA